MTNEELRSSLEKIAWKHYNPEASINVEEMLDEMMPVIDQAREETFNEERQFILNVLDGIDTADEQMGNTGCGTKAIRLALQGRSAPLSDNN